MPDAFVTVTLPHSACSSSAVLSTHTWYGPSARPAPASAVAPVAECAHGVYEAVDEPTSRILTSVSKPAPVAVRSSPPMDEIVSGNRSVQEIVQLQPPGPLGQPSSPSHSSYSAWMMPSPQYGPSSSQPGMQPL